MFSVDAVRYSFADVLTVSSLLNAGRRAPESGVPPLVPLLYLYASFSMFLSITELSMQFLSVTPLVRREVLEKTPVVSNFN